jgi:carbamoyltransferase
LVILGLGYTAHEASAALVVDGKVVDAIARERLTRLKRDGILYGSCKLSLDVAVNYCLERHGLALSDVDLVIWNHIDHPTALHLTAQLMAERSQGFGGSKCLALPHHFAHACCAFYLSPFKEGAVLVADSSGGPLDRIRDNCVGPEAEVGAAGVPIIQRLCSASRGALESESFYYCDGKVWSCIRKITGHGIGGRYGKISQILFDDPLDAGKTMGLAPYGVPVQSSLLECKGPPEMPTYEATHGPEWELLKSQIEVWRSAKDPVRDYKAPLPAGVARGIQDEAEEALLAYARWLRQSSNSTNLCIAGGVALNCVANSRIAEESGFKNVFIPSAPGDDGIALGCALYGAAVQGELQRGSSGAFMGRSYSHTIEEIASFGFISLFPSPEIESWIAQQIADGAVVGWFQGSAEMGPRALGHRSFLADPRNRQVRDHMNKVVKLRETFRPFAPVVLEEAVLEFFEQSYPSYFMSFVATVRADKRSQIPAVTHVDGTARYQVLRKADNPELDALIRAFMRITGVPMLLNTSFNRAGEPIVETPQDAARCALASSADYLVLDGSVYKRGS